MKTSVDHRASRLIQPWKHLLSSFKAGPSGPTPFVSHRHVTLDCLPGESCLPEVPSLEEETAGGLVELNRTAQNKSQRLRDRMNE